MGGGPMTCDSSQLQHRRNFNGNIERERPGADRKPCVFAGFPKEFHEKIRGAVHYRRMVDESRNGVHESV